MVNTTFMYCPNYYKSHLNRINQYTLVYLEVVCHLVEKGFYFSHGQTLVGRGQHVTISDMMMMMMIASNGDQKARRLEGQMP